MRRRRAGFVAAVVLLFVATQGPRAQKATAPSGELPEYGPAKGTLVIVGGGNLNGSGINEKFIELAGGPEKKFVIVPTAGGNRNAQGELIAYDEQRIVAPWLRLGLKNVRINSSGCLDRCELGPTMVIYPEGVWYSVTNQQDIDEVLQTHLVEGGRVERLMLKTADKLPKDRVKV